MKRKSSCFQDVDGIKLNIFCEIHIKILKFFIPLACKSEGEVGSAEEQPFGNMICRMG